MVEMLVAVQQILDVGEAVAERPNGIGDEIGGFLRAPVNQYVALIPDDQDRRDTASADEIGVGVDADGRCRFGPGRDPLSVFAGERPARPKALDGCARLATPQARTSR